MSLHVIKASKSHRRRSGPGDNHLLNNLIAYWPGDEAAGNALDVHVNALHLADTNTATSNPGIVYPLARQYTAANSEYHTRPGDDALLSTGDIDFTLSCWVYMDTVPGTEMRFLTKWQSVAWNREYILTFVSATQRIGFAVRDAADIFTTNITANTFGLPVVSTWYLVIAWHDALNNHLRIQVNNGGVDSINYALGVQDGGAPFRIGAIVGVGSYMNGRVGPTTMHKSAAGGGGVLTATRRAALWNNGAGLTYAEFTD